MCYMHDQPGWQTTVLRLLDMFVDGLRVQPEGEGKVKDGNRAVKKAAKRKKR